MDETRTAPKVYRFEMSKDQHGELLDVVKAVKGKVLLIGYDSALYQEKLADWKCHAFDVPNNAASGESKRTMTELLWCNFGTKGGETT